MDVRFDIASDTATSICRIACEKDVEIIVAEPHDILDMWVEEIAAEEGMEGIEPPTYDQCRDILQRAWQDFYQVFTLDGHDIMRHYLREMMRVHGNRPEVPSNVVDFVQWKRDKGRL